MKKLVFFCLIILFTMAMASAAENRETLTLTTSGLNALSIDCGAGELKVQGDEKLEQIEVSAVLHVEGISEAELLDFKKEDVILKLEKSGSKAVLTAKIDDSFSLERLFGSREAYIDLDIRLPRRLTVEVDDGSGNITIRDLDNGLELEDGSGDIDLDDISGRVEINDGSGDMSLTNLKGNVKIDDGSGDIELKTAGGDVFVEDGSGEMELYGIAGSVEIDDGSGNIVIDGVEKDVTIDEAGSGDLEIDNVKGKVRK